MIKKIKIQEEVKINITGNHDFLELSIDYRDTTYNLIWTLEKGIEIDYELSKIKDIIKDSILEFLRLETI
jgi:hypothetical protein